MDDTHTNGSTQSGRSIFLSRTLSGVTLDILGDFAKSPLNFLNDRLCSLDLLSGTLELIDPRFDTGTKSFHDFGRALAAAVVSLVDFTRVGAE